MVGRRTGLAVRVLVRIIVMRDNFMHSVLVSQGATLLRAAINLKTHLIILFLIAATALSLAQTATDNSARLLGVEGRVEVARAGVAAWSAGSTNQLLNHGDRVRTGPRSRAIIRLSAASMLRVNELTTLEIRPPQAKGGNASLEVNKGSTYFFNRERPGTVEFRTPLASGAIRGTEFHLLVADNGRTEVALLDGAVDFTNSFGGLSLAPGEQGVVDVGQPPRRTALLEASSIIQWVLYYPAILDVDEIGLSDAERTALADSLAAYRAGDLLAAQSSYPENRPSGSEAERIYRAATLLAVGQSVQATQLVNGISSPLAAALRQMVGTVQGHPASRGESLKTASEWMVESYARQAQSNLEGALEAAHKASAQSPHFAFAWARVAEMEFSFANNNAAQRALDKSLALSPRLAPAHALKGFVLAGQGKFAAGETSFNDAVALDSALANAWLGRGLLRIRAGHGVEGRQDLQVAATLEPRRSILRSYLAKAWSQAHDPARALKELRLAQQLDPNDPTPWLYSAILHQQGNRVNEAIGDLEHSQELNDNRSVFRSRLLLDQDKAVRSVNLALIYQDAGMTDWSVREASRAVSYDYANFSAHQFLANSYNGLRDPKQINLRYEAPAVSEYFIASLLSPVGATPLSQAVSQQEYTRLFDRDHAGIASSTEYFSGGDWVQQGSQYGRFGNMDYSLDVLYRRDTGERPNNDVEQTQFAARVRQQVTPQDTFYFEAQRTETESGDVLQYYNQKGNIPGVVGPSTTLRVNEVQAPYMFLGYHHEWSPGHHTLALVGRLEDDFSLGDPNSAALEFFHNPAGNVVSIRPRPFAVGYASDLVGYLAELQQIATVKSHTLVLGGRFQSAVVETSDYLVLSPGAFPGQNVFPTTSATVDERINRVSFYAYDMWQVFKPLQLTAGLAYDLLDYPQAIEISPISVGDTTRAQLSPKGGFIWQPFTNSTFRGAYTRSLGGVFFDNSFRLEPTQVGGFNQALRSVIPESVQGNVAGTSFETFGLAFEQKFPTRTYFTIAGEVLESEAQRDFGVFARKSGRILAERSTTPQELDYQERSVTIALNQLVGDKLAFGVRYRISDADLNARYTAAPVTVNNAAQDNQAVLQQLQLYALVNLPCGFFSEFQAIWSQQSNYDYSPDLPGDNFWQFNAFVGYRFWQRHAEARVGLLNITDQDYKLNPLNLYSELPRDRTFYASFKFYF